MFQKLCWMRLLCLVLLTLSFVTAQMDFFFNEDECYEESTDTYGPCDKSRFPTCGDNESICYNRRPRRDRFHTDIRQPYYYIDYRSVMCYPSDWDGCSSCSPGRYCMSESRCILEEVNYNCAQWI